MTTEEAEKKTCFIAMPITTREHEATLYGDEDHWTHVREVLFVKAVMAAGFQPIRPEASGSHMIHGVIIRHLEQADMVLCDLSGHNPNVFFELGVRTSLDKPIALVRDKHLPIPFDTNGLNTHTYKADLLAWDIEDEIQRLRRHLLEAEESCGGKNPLWTAFGLTARAREPHTAETREEAKLDYLVAQVDRIQERERARDHEARLVHQEARRTLAAFGGDETLPIPSPRARLLLSDLIELGIVEPEAAIESRPGANDVVVLTRGPLSAKDRAAALVHAQTLGIESIRWDRLSSDYLELLGET